MPWFNTKINGHLNHSSLAKKYNILYKYMAASHGKGLIDAMSSFCEKIILKRDIVDLDLWFSDSWENCEYLDMCKDLQMSYSVIGQASVDSKRKGKTARKIMASW